MCSQVHLKSNVISFTNLYKESRKHKTKQLKWMEKNEPSSHLRSHATYIISLEIVFIIVSI